MDYLLLYGKSKTEQDNVKKHLKDNVAFASEEELSISAYTMIQSTIDHVSGNDPVDMAVLEISGDEEIAMSHKVREEKEHALMMLVAEGTISPMKYLTPQIRACSLLLKPYDDEMLDQSASQFVREYYRQKEGADEEGMVLIESRQGKVRIPGRQVYYIEVRGKKVYFRTKDKEYSKYDSLENIKEQLPDYFIQCHRSYLFNSKYIERVKLSENTIYLENGITVPLSRTYKRNIKEYMNELSAR